MARRISSSLRRFVRQRSAGICEYCHTSEQWQYVSFTIDHVVPLHLGGEDDAENLALACFHCNRQIGEKILAIDPVSDEEAPLFNPRQQMWSDHFAWSADKLQIVGLSSTGRATVAALQLNRERILAIRAADRLVDRHPPIGDPVLEQ